MSAIDNPPHSPRPAASGPGDLDQMLRAYFHAELPPLWPAPPVARPSEPLSLPVPAPRPFDFARSRWALAASVLVLLLGHAALTRYFPEQPAPNLETDSGQLTGHRNGLEVSKPAELTPQTPRLPR